MPKLNPHFSALKKSYLFQKIAEKTAAHQKKRPQNSLINLGIGDIQKPLIPSCVEAMREAAVSFAKTETFQGYPPAEGYSFLRNQIASFEYQKTISPEEIFITAGAKNSCVEILQLFSSENIVAVQDPSYPVYVNGSLFSGMDLVYQPCLEETDFIPKLPEKPVDIIYLCSPNNPTGKALDRKALKTWVDYAVKQQSIILFDGAYEGFITSDAPHSIYSIPGAKKVAIEIRSFSKKGGFTNLRCGYTVIPNECQIKGVSLIDLWRKRLHSSFGGVSYPIQKAAEACYFPEGKKELALQMEAYQEQAAFLKQKLVALGYTVFGGIDAPYLWWKTPQRIPSWDFFEQILEKGVITIPGEGFGPSGEGFVRLSTFASIDKLQEAASRIQKGSLCVI